MIQAHCVAPHAREPPQLPKHVKFEPSDAQSELIVHAFEHAFAKFVHPASVTADSARHESPAAHSESELQAVPAGLSVELLQAKRTRNRPVAVSRSKRIEGQATAGSTSRHCVRDEVIRGSEYHEHAGGRRAGLASPFETRGREEDACGRRCAGAVAYGLRRSVGGPPLVVRV